MAALIVFCPMTLITSAIFPVLRSSSVPKSFAGQVIPYANQRAYTDRLNTLFTPGGWTRKYSVHTRPNFERGKERKIVAKVFVTSDLTIFGVGSHAVTGVLPSRWYWPLPAPFSH
jgi:hypothetical protein